MFERQVLRKIFGLIPDQERWRIRSNNKLKKLIKGEDTVKYVKAQRIRWWEHVQRMEDIKLVIKITDCKPMGVRTRRGSKNRWRDVVVNDLKKRKQKLDLSRQR